MSTISDVQNAMVQIIADAVYPDGTSSPSVTGTSIYVYPGDPVKANLDIDLKAGLSHVAVFAQQGMSRNTTRLRDLYCDQDVEIATIILVVNNNTVTVNGIVTVGQSAMVIVDGTGYSYMAQEGDTLDSIASELADLIPNSSAVANVVTINTALSIVARTTVPGTMRRILTSEEGIFRARVIAPSHEFRETIGDALQIAFATLTPRYYMLMLDGISASIRSKGIDEKNPYELELGFLRDYLYLVEYHTVQVNSFYTITDAYADVEIDPTLAE
jgi:hypothetical protein